MTDEEKKRLLRNVVLQKIKPMTDDLTQRLLNQDFSNNPVMKKIADGIKQNLPEANKDEIVGIIKEISSTSKAAEIADNIKEKLKGKIL